VKRDGRWCALIPRRHLLITQRAATRSRAAGQPSDPEFSLLWALYVVVYRYERSTQFPMLFFLPRFPSDVSETQRPSQFISSLSLSKQNYILQPT
jgi:hypothetical protein